jgi:hypothetical protein
VIGGPVPLRLTCSLRNSVVWFSFLRADELLLLCAIVSGRSQTHSFIFSAVRFSPHLDGCSSDKLTNGVVGDGMADFLADLSA